MFTVVHAISVNNLVTSRPGFSFVFRQAMLWNWLNEVIKIVIKVKFKRVLRIEVFSKYYFDDFDGLFCFKTPPEVIIRLFFFYLFVYPSSK